MDDDSLWVQAAYVEPLDAPPPTPPLRTNARRALAFAILGVVCFGFVFGPLALAIAHRARLATIAAPHLNDVGITEAATAVGKAGMALHLAIVITALPWLLFMLPFLRG